MVVTHPHPYHPLQVNANDLHELGEALPDGTSYLGLHSCALTSLVAWRVLLPSLPASVTELQVRCAR